MAGGRNIPIENLLSQHLGNLLLNELDQFVAHNLKIKLSPRYMDNKSYFNDDSKLLHSYLDLIEKFANEKLDLKLSQKDICRCDNGVLFIGYRHFPGYILLKKSTAKRFKKNIKKLIQYTSKMAAYYGHAKHANAYNFRQKTGIDCMLKDAQNKIKEVKMRGFPKYTDIATKYDVENLKGIFPKETKKFLETLKNDRFIWICTNILGENETGITDATHKVVETKETTEENSAIIRQQLELQEDPNARIFRMGYTLEQVDELIESLS